LGIGRYWRAPSFVIIFHHYMAKEPVMDQFRKPHKKQPEPDTPTQKKKEKEPDPMKPQNEEPEKHQVGHQLAKGERKRAPDEGQSRHRDKSKDRS
jgi:hypothetical protein